MTRGILVFAKNNSQVDYLKQAYFLAKRARQYLDLPVTVVTDGIKYVKTFDDYDKVFDQIVEVDYTEGLSSKRYYDGSLAHRILRFKNDNRAKAYEYSPYDETLLLDTDIVIGDNKYLSCFDQANDFLCYRKAYDLAAHRDYSEFDYINDVGVEFYWATVVFFRKTEENEMFFNLVLHIQENWTHYRMMFDVKHATFRNDHAFSIAIHIMNGFQKGDFSKEPPGRLVYCTDRDVLVSINDNRYIFLVEKENHVGEYVLVSYTGTVHIMNKFSLGLAIDGELA